MWHLKCEAILSTTFFLDVHVFEKSHPIAMFSQCADVVALLALPGVATANPWMGGAAGFGRELYTR
jgi:hypothetical protein